MPVSIYYKRAEGHKVWRRGPTALCQAGVSSLSCTSIALRWFSQSCFQNILHCPHCTQHHSYCRWWNPPDLQGDTGWRMRCTVVVTIPKVTFYQTSWMMQTSRAVTEKKLSGLHGYSDGFSLQSTPAVYIRLAPPAASSAWQIPTYSTSWNLLPIGRLHKAYAQKHSPKSS